jgi:deoxyribodipyrimidine photo-lyase
MKTILYIYRRDRRIVDNTALQAATKSGLQVLPCFIFDPAQITTKNTYLSKNALLFMFNSLTELSHAIEKNKGTLYVWYGNPTQIVQQLITDKIIDAVYINTDYTPFSKKRDAALKALCTQLNITFNAYHDSVLNPPDSIMTGKGIPYSIFTPFYKRALQEPVLEPNNSTLNTWYTKPLSNCISLTEAHKKFLGPYTNTKIILSGGRTEGLSILQNIHTQTAYLKNRDICALSTTHLSAHLKFGTVSIREVYYAIQNTLGKNHTLIKQLYWRDFWTYVAYHTPRVFSHAYHTQYDTLPWNNDNKLFTLWCTGNTGFPIVDAGMRELNTTGFMHNRVRMIVASFLTKDLHIDWRGGEKYFARQLVDYDPAVNNGNWQWAASTGCDGQPYFRIFNPWLQQKKFDPLCIYIQRWVPELKKYTPAQIHAQLKKPLAGYLTPIIDHAIEAIIAKNMYKSKKSRT